MSEEFRKLIVFLMNSNITFYTGEHQGNYHVVGYRERNSTTGVDKLWEVDDRPDGLRFYNMISPCEPYELSYKDIIKYIAIIEERA